VSETSDESAFDETLATLSDGDGEPTRGTFTVGDVLAGRYEVVACLGAGAMGEVYRVRDRQLDEVVALKRLTLASKGEAAERFLREVKLGRRVTHRNVARTHDVGEHDGALFLTMELVEGTTLEDVLDARGGRLAVDEATRLCRQVLEGLAAAHDAGIVHRDLKPANVLVGADGRAVLTDFGIARAAAEPALTRAQQLVGTPIYMAPEQVTGRPVDHRADLYAFGVMLFELLTGEWPFRGETAIELALARVTQEPVDPRSLGVPELLAGVILRCLEREPAARPASARDVLDLLDGRATPAPMRPAAPLADAVMVESLAVLPFAYRGPSEEDYLGTGLAEELVDVLGRLRGIRVLAFSATHALGPLADPIEVAKRLEVGHVVAGSIQLRGRDVRITARLLDGDGSQRWSERFEGQLDDVFELQESMSRRVAEALRLELSTHSHGRVPSEAVELYFRARRHMLVDGYSDVEGPLGDLERCIAIAPTFAPAYALHAAASARSWFTANVLSSSSNAQAAARSSVARALVAAPDHPDTHLARGILALQDLDAGEAARAFVRTLELAPTLALAQLYLGGIQMELGRLDESKRRLKLAAELDPSLTSMTEVSLARMAYFDGDFLAYERHLEATRHYDEGLARFADVRAALWSRSREHALVVLNAGIGEDRRRRHFDGVLGIAAGIIPPAEGDAMLVEFLSKLDNPRFQQLVRQFTVDAFGALGEEELGVRWLDELMGHPFVDRDWLERSPALASLRATESYRRAVSQVRERSRDILRTDLAATRSSYG